MAYDGRETAPAARLFRPVLGQAGKPLPYDAVVGGGRSACPPRLLELAHRNGKLPGGVVEPAITLSSRALGSPRLNINIAGEKYDAGAPGRTFTILTAPAVGIR
jgi:gamma-glutamyltranspeptidase/glutathione hydrolase